ncbi:MAG: hypothetical protein M1379_03820 [Firmicutes bacterium]|nr:hypothetical protein [Bacillota bacterium]
MRTKVWNDLMALQDQELDKLIQTVNGPSPAFLTQAGVVDGIFRCLKQVSTLFSQCNVGAPEISRSAIEV